MGASAPTTDDRDWARALARGEDEATCRFVQSHSATGYAVAFQILEDEGAAEDVLQDAFFRAYQKAGTFRGEAKLSSWFYRIVYNLALNALKQRSRKPTDRIKNPDLLAEQEMLPSLEETLRAALGEIDPRDRLVLYLHYYEGYRMAEIGEILNIREPAAKVRVHRARKRLKRRLERGNERPGKATEKASQG
ncbi:MAG TPA: RNA polymerase sigma factor [Acidobacteriota bacterium]|nr:RNA polymerase sigma factor [Acidobacteriota bacterium]